MDKYNLRISVMGNENIINSIKKVETIDRLSVSCIKIDVADENTYNTADVIIFDANQNIRDIYKVYRKKAPYCVIVLVCEDEDIMDISLKYQDEIFDIWKNDCCALFNYRVRNFLFRMRDYLDAELAQKQLDTLIDSVPDLIWFKDVIGSHIKVNDSFCKTVNKTKEQIKYRGHCYIWDLDIAEYEQGEYVCMETEEVVIKEQGTFLFDEKVKISDEMRQLKTYKSAIVGRNGETLGTVGLARDVTDIWNTHAEFKTLINHLPFPMMIVNKDYNFVSANDEFDNIFGVLSDLSDFDISIFGKKFFNSDIAMKKELNNVIESKLINNGKTLTFSIEKSPIYDVFQELNGYFFIFNDITTQKEYEQKLKLISQTDDLTGLNNRIAIRNYFDANHSNVINNKTPISVMMLDIDYFKNYNDMYGHVSGDKILTSVGDILNKISQDDNDIFVSRYGGEEFLIVALNKSVDETKNIATNIQSMLREYNIENKSSEISDVLTVSIGISYYPEINNTHSVSELIKSADKMLYKAKDSGRNTYAFSNN